MTDTLTDEGVIHEFMHTDKIWPIDNLNFLHKVEERLTEEQWHSYIDHWKLRSASAWLLKDLIHASAEQKIKALGAVLRAEGKHE